MPMPRTIHPGETLSAMLGEHRITQFRLAQAIGVPPRRISEIVRERRPITADTALRLGRALGTTAQFWLRLQAAYDLERAHEAAGGDIDVIEPLVSSAPPDARQAMMQALEDEHGRPGGLLRLPEALRWLLTR